MYIDLYSVFLYFVFSVVISFAINLKDWVYLWQLVGLILVIIKYKKNEINVKKNYSIISILAIFLIAIGSVLPPYNSWGRFIKLWNRVAVVNSFVVYTYQVDDIVQSLKPTLNNSLGMIMH